MKYALDTRNGTRINHVNVYSNNNRYICIHCSETVFVRKGFNPCFYHQPIHDRTPLQRTCPEYHENSSYKKIDSELDKLYINNGGIPVYLCGDINSGRFELRAYFPSISENIMKQLIDSDVKVYVNSKSNDKTSRAMYSIDNLKFYKITSLQPWIDIYSLPNTDHFSEVKRKWLWGIRGIDIEKDIFHSNNDGGYRLSIKASVYVGKAYRILYKDNFQNLNGIEAKKIGLLSLKDGLRTININIYEIKINKYSQEARSFIESKGYKLLEKSDELIPLWPPAAFCGKELTFNQSRGLFLHINNSSNGKIFSESNVGLTEINSEKKLSVIPMPIINGKTISLSNNIIEEAIPEIKFGVIYRKNFFQKQVLQLDYIIKDTTDNEIDFSIDNSHLPKDRKYIIKSNIPFTATVSKENYVFFSSETCFDNLEYNTILKINFGAFGIKKYNFKKKQILIKESEEIDWELEYLKIYDSVGPTVISDNESIILLDLISKKLSTKNSHLYRLIEKWVKTNSIPVIAIPSLKNLFRRVY